MIPDRLAISLPHAILGLLLAVWVSLGAWICFAAPYASGTDESMRYVAYAAAKNRWVSQEDATAFGIDHSYYPPFYFLLFAPFFRDEPAFTTTYPEGGVSPARFNGAWRLVSWENLRPVPRELLLLYRTAKVASLLFGVGIIGCLVATLRRLFTGPNRDWLVLGGTIPLLLLPQFLYYQTLANNDCLVNFLCALASFFFVAAACSAERGDGVSSRRQGIFCAVAIGLGLFTKQSAVVLIPLLPTLAFLQVRSGKSPQSGASAGRLRRLLMLSSVCFAAGGWWLLRSALAGDLSGMLAQRLTHPWAFEHSIFGWDFISEVIGGVVRSYIALFAGELFGIPDRIYLIYLFIAAVLGSAILGTAMFRLFGNRNGSAPSRAHRGVWTVLFGTLAFNLALILYYNLEIFARHGRLLFPSLVALHALFALGLHTFAWRSRRLLVTLVCTLIVSLGGLFLWTFKHRMVPAVTQPEEHLVLLGINPRVAMSLNPLWETHLQQPLLLPPGLLTGLRFPLASASSLPQIGTVILGRLMTQGDGPETREHRFIACSIGDSDASERWTEITLETPLDLRSLTPALLMLDAEKPWFRFPGTDYGYQLIPLDNSPLLKPLFVNGERSGFGLALTAVYR